MEKLYACPAMTEQKMTGLLFRHSPGVTDENHENPQSGYEATIFGLHYSL
jgi:hypothetical protein